VIDASRLKAGQIDLTINGGDGDDKITGSAGNDVVIGGRGSDTAMLGAGDDTFVWNPGDGSDVVNGQAGNDTLVFNGSNANETIVIGPDGKGGATLTRDVANITMSLDNVETIDLSALGGADTVTVNDMTGTDVSNVNIDLGFNGAGDGSVDTVVINATNHGDSIFVTNTNGVITVSGLDATVTIKNFEANDKLVINGLGGDDVISVVGQASGMVFTFNGGDGDDILVGGPGNDTLLGGNGDDVLIGGGGQDVLDGGPGDNVVIADGVGIPPFLQVGGGANTALLAQFAAASFVTDGGDNSEMPLVDPAAIQQPMLTQPHA
jgi:Ca2+-binding RTX toxin-like protein